MRRSLFVAVVVAVVAIGLAVPARAHGRYNAAVGGTVRTSDQQGTYTSVLTGHALQPKGKTVTFQMTVHAQPCCTVHSFVLGPWSGTWSIGDNNGNTLSGTADGAIDAGCVPPIALEGFCSGADLIGPGASFTLTITGATGSYEGWTGTGSFSAEQTPQSADLASIPEAAFAGTITF